MSGKKKALLSTDKSAFFWSKWRDSNSRLPVPETGALPPALHLDNLNYYIVAKAFCQGEVLKFYKNI